MALREQLGILLTSIPVNGTVGAGSPAREVTQKTGVATDATVSRKTSILGKGTLFNNLLLFAYKKLLFLLLYVLKKLKISL